MQQEGAGPGSGRCNLTGELGTGSPGCIQSPAQSSQAPENVWTLARSTQWSSLPCLTSSLPPHPYTLPPHSPALLFASRWALSPTPSPQNHAPGLVPSPSLCLSLRTLTGPGPPHHDEITGFLAADAFPLCHCLQGNI